MCTHSKKTERKSPGAIKCINIVFQSQIRSNYILEPFATCIVAEPIEPKANKIRQSVLIWIKVPESNKLCLKATVNWITLQMVPPLAPRIARHNSTTTLGNCEKSRKVQTYKLIRSYLLCLGNHLSTTPSTSKPLTSLNWLYVRLCRVNIFPETEDIAHTALHRSTARPAQLSTFCLNFSKCLT